MNSIEKRTTIESLLTDHTLTNKQVLEASYQISLFIAKSEKNNIGENLIKLSISVFHKTVQQHVQKLSLNG